MINGYESIRNYMMICKQKKLKHQRAEVLRQRALLRIGFKQLKSYWVRKNQKKEAYKQASEMYERR